MLHTLRIRQLIIIDDLTVEFGPGLNLLTGETGAGKSILVDALGLVVGERADRSLVRTGAERAIVEAVFEIEARPDLARWARDRGLDEAAETTTWIVRREVASQGNGRAFLNGSPITVSMLREAGALLLESHGQHDQQSLLAEERHLELLDRFGDHPDELARVGAAHRAVLEAASALAALKERAGAREARREELLATVEAIDGVAPQAGELQALEAERYRLRHAAEWSSLIDEVVAATHDGEPSATSLAWAAARNAEALAEIDGELAEMGRRIESAAVELQDLGAAYRDVRDRAEFDPGRLEFVEGRRAAIEGLLLRYGENEEVVLRARDEAREELGRLADLDAEIASAGEGLRAAERGYVSASGKLGRSRRKAGRALGPAVEAQLARLALEKARVTVRLDPASGPEIEGRDGKAVALNARGAERAAFMLAANPGEPARPLARVASGGELSRVMLAFHAVIDGAGEGRVLVFDEVDAGVSGAVADAVGARLARLAREQQVLCVTHLPQVAAYAHRHYRVAKRVEGRRTRAEVTGLDRPDRVEELARMLAGREPTAASRRHAAELIRAAGRLEGAGTESSG